MSKFWLYFGIFLACTGVGTVPGIIFIILYFADDIKKSIYKANYDQSTFPDDGKNRQYFDDETAERMK